MSQDGQIWRGILDKWRAETLQTEADKLKAKADRPLRSGKPQRPADFGLFDVAGRAQLDIADLTPEEE